MVRNDVPTIVYEEPQGREARIARDGDGLPIGLALFFTPDELTDIGIDPTSVDKVVMQVRDGEVCIKPTNPKNK